MAPPNEWPVINSLFFLVLEVVVLPCDKPDLLLLCLPVESRSRLIKSRICSSANAYILLDRISVSGPIQLLSIGSLTWWNKLNVTNLMIFPSPWIAETIVRYTDVLINSILNIGPLETGLLGGWSRTSSTDTRFLGSPIAFQNPLCTLPMGPHGDFTSVMLTVILVI